MGREEAGHAQEDVAGGVARALDDALARRQRRGNVAPPPGIRQIERRCLRARGNEVEDLSFADPFPVRPGCELFDLALQLVGVLPDEIDE